jgi:hypothetical protein
LHNACVQKETVMNVLKAGLSSLLVLALIQSAAHATKFSAAEIKIAKKGLNQSIGRAIERVGADPKAMPFMKRQVASALVRIGEIDRVEVKDGSTLISGSGGYVTLDMPVIKGGLINGKLRTYTFKSAGEAGPQHEHVSDHVIETDGTVKSKVTIKAFSADGKVPLATLHDENKVFLKGPSAQ